MGSNGNARGVSFGCSAQQMGARGVLAKGGCKQALRASWCPQAPPVYPPAPSERSVPWGKVTRLRKLKGRFSPPSGDTLCCSSCSTSGTSSLPGPSGCKQEVCSLPFPLQNHAQSLSLIREAHSQLRWGLLYLLSQCTQFPPCTLLEGRLFLSPVSPKRTH